MAKINNNFQKLQGAYLFAEIARRVNKYIKENPEADIIKLGIGDVTEPLVPAVIEAMHKAVDEMATKEGFKGYGPDLGYLFLREAIRDNDYASRGVDIDVDEIYISDGAKCDIGNFQEILSIDCTIAVADPVYPVYVDTNVMAGRAGEYSAEIGGFTNVVYLPCREENGFLPDFPKGDIDVVYLCFPNNPSGMVAPLEYLEKWVEYAIANEVIILYDAAYEAFIVDDDVPHSIFEIEGAKQCAVEFRSFSKKAGFTGTRCAFTVVPNALMGKDEDGNPQSIGALWSRRQATKFNGVSYITQCGAAAVYSEEGKKQAEDVIKYYLENARLIKEALEAMGMTVFGGVNAPYIWLKCPNGMKSWELFDKLLNEINVVGTPGSGFGKNGEGYFRLTAFGSRENTIRAIDRIKNELTL